MRTRALLATCGVLIAAAMPAILAGGCTGMSTESKTAAMAPAPRARATAGPTSYTPVTDQRLVNPEAENWLMYRRTYDGWGYSPLEQITPANAATLVPVWTFSTGVAEGHQAPPIVNNGVMFVSTPQNQVLALDAKSGELLWRYKRELARGSLPAPSDQPRRRALRGQGVPRHARRARRRARRQDRQGRLGPDGGGLQEGLLHDPGAPRRQGKDHRRRLGRRARDPRVRPGPGRSNRQLRVEDVHDPRSGRAGIGHLEGRHVAHGRSLRLDHRDVRPAAQPHVLGHRQCGPVDRRPAPRRQPLLGVGARPGRRHRQAARLSPVPLERLVGLGRGLGARF